MQPTGTATLPRMLRMATTADPDRHAPYLPTPRYAQESTRAYAGPRVWRFHRECSCDVHLRLRETATAATSLAACGAGCQHKCISILRRRWGCAAALTGARLRMSRAYLAGGWGGRSRRSRRRRRGRRLRFRRRRAYGRGEFAPVLARRSPGWAAPPLGAALLLTSVLTLPLACTLCCTFVGFGVPLRGSP